MFGGNLMLRGDLAGVGFHYYETLSHVKVNSDNRYQLLKDRFDCITSANDMSLYMVYYKGRDLVNVLNIIHRRAGCFHSPNLHADADNPLWTYRYKNNDWTTLSRYSPKYSGVILNRLSHFAGNGTFNVVPDQLRSIRKSYQTYISYLTTFLGKGD